MKIKILYIVITSIILSGCLANKAIVTIDYFPPQNKSIVLLEPDIELSEHTVGGMLIPKSNWTKTAKENLNRAIQSKMNSINGRIKNIEISEVPDEKEIQLMKTLAAIGTTVLVYNYTPNLSLPTKKDDPVWSMGKETYI